VCPNGPILVFGQVDQKVVTFCESCPDGTYRKFSFATPKMSIQTGYYCVRTGLGWKCLRELSSSFSQKSLSHDFTLSHLGFFPKTHDSWTWSTKRDLRFHHSIWGKFEISKSLEFWYKYWEIEDNLPSFFRFWVFWSTLSILQALGHTLCI